MSPACAFGTDIAIAVALKIKTGSAFGDDNFGEQIKRRMDSVKDQCSTLSNKLQAFMNETKDDHKRLICEVFSHF